MRLQASLVHGRRDEVELDEGELIKSSPDIKIAFLRQEFREDLRDSRTLKEEFTSAFAEVRGHNKTLDM